MIDFTKLLDITYWLRPGPGDLSEPFLAFFTVFFALFIVMKILLRFMGRQYVRELHRVQQRILYKIEALLLTMGVLGLIWTFFRYEHVPYFSARIMMVLWVLGLIVWGYYIYYYACYHVPDVLRRESARDQKRKYFVKGRRS